MSDFHTLTSMDNLTSCWLKAKQNKSNSLRVQRFGDDPLRYLSTIQQRLRDREFTFGPYKTFTVREKKFRDVIDAPMKDRIVHWMLYRYMLPIWQPRFIHDTYGNLPGKGTHAAIDRVAEFARSEKNQWVLQLDISKYFYSVPHNKLKERALRYIGDHDVRQVITNLIDSFCTDDKYDSLFDADSSYRNNPFKGMPIGNLTSQLLANIYLHDFDHWIKETMRIQAYARYVDDIVILGNDRHILEAICFLIRAKMAENGLTIHPKKIRIAPVSAGIPFLGYVIWPNHISAGSYVRRRYIRRLREHENGGFDHSEGLRSYRAILAHTGSTL